MSTCLPADVRSTNSLLKATSDLDLLTFIEDAEIYIFTALAKKYYIPFESADSIQLKVSITNASNIITATTSDFSNYNKKDFISINNDVFLIIEKISNTQIRVSRNFDYSASDLKALFFPKEIVFAIKYFAAKLALMKSFTEQSYNQDTIPFFKNFDTIYNPIIKSIVDGSWSSSKIKLLGSGSSSASNSNNILASSNIMRVNVKTNGIRNYIDYSFRGINSF